MPNYGTNINSSLVQASSAAMDLRGQVEREIRRTLQELAPGADPGVILDVLVDVTVDSHVQTSLTVNMSVMHSVGYVPPLVNFAADHEPVPPSPFEVLTRDHGYRQFLPSLPSPPPAPDYTFPLTGIAGMDQGRTGDCTVGFMAREIQPMGVFNPNAFARVPTMPLQANPTISIDEIQNRRYNLTDRAIVGFEPRPPLHPWIQAVIRKKRPAPTRVEPVVIDAEPFRGLVPPRVSAWKRLRENYSLYA